jgi:hypothetical protein
MVADPTQQAFRRTFGVHRRGLAARGAPSEVPALEPPSPALDEARGRGVCGAMTAPGCDVRCRVGD